MTFKMSENIKSKKAKLYFSDRLVSYYASVSVYVCVCLSVRTDLTTTNGELSAKQKAKIKARAKNKGGQCERKRGG